MLQDYDLHIHSNKSDGKLSVEQILTLLRIKDIHTFSITDHDNIESIKILKKLDLSGLTCILGVEMSVRTKNYKAHILGYGINGDCSKIIELCDIVKNTRIERLYKMVEYLRKKFNIEINKTIINEIIRKKIETNTSMSERRDLGEVLIDLGICRSQKEANEKYLEYDDYLPKYRVDARDVINAIHSAEGKAILAHPILLEKKYDKDITQIIDEFIEIGIDGIEVFNSKHKKEDCTRYYSLALQKGLLISGGSDFHREPSTYMGMITGDEKGIKIDKKFISILNNVSTLDTINNEQRDER